MWVFQRPVVMVVETTMSCGGVGVLVLVSLDDTLMSSSILFGHYAEQNVWPFTFWSFGWYIMHHISPSFVSFSCKSLQSSSYRWHGNYNGWLECWVYCGLCPIKEVLVSLHPWGQTIRYSSEGPLPGRLTTTANQRLQITWPKVVAGKDSIMALWTIPLRG